LLARVERAGEDGPISRNFEWQYDDRDRLVSAEAVDHSTAEFERAFSAEYGYNSEDRLTQLTRFVSGVEVEHQTWEWEGDRLTARTYRSPGLAELAETHGGESWEWAYPGGLDTYERTLTDWTSNPWSSAVPIERGDCEMLPQGPGHGYPAAEIEYDLTWSMDQRPSGIGFAYGNDSYGWNYGDLAWFGHAGLGSSWLGAPMLSGDFEVLARVEYDDEGRMIREFAETRGPTGSLGSERTRTFEASGLAADHVIFRFEEEVTERTLLFERDALGELTRRVLLEGDDPLAEQRWTRDSAGRTVGVEVDPHSGLQPTVFDAFGQPSGFGTMEAPGGSWQWAYDEVDRVVRRSSGESEQTLAYDGEGRLVEVTGTFDNSVWPMRHEYDDAGRLTEECTPHGTDDWYCRHHVLDDAGRPHATFARNGASQEWLLESWTDYRCVGR
jgi:YD repeat-containing protein